jgi:hypothetical protein
MTKDKLIHKIIEAYFDLCQNDTEANDETIFDLLMYGFKGLKNMSMDELKKEWEDISDQI